MKVDKIINNLFASNTYFIINKGKALVVDPGSNSKEIIEYIENNKLEIVGLLVTHYHSDHTASLSDIKRFTSKIYDIKTLGNIKVNPFSFETILNLGHSKDSVSFYFEKEKVLFSGDFIFKETIGATHFDGGSPEEMEISLKDFVKRYPENTKIYPGHGEETSVLYECKNNFYIKKYGGIIDS